MYHIPAHKNMTDKYTIWEMHVPYIYMHVRIHKRMYLYTYIYKQKHAYIHTIGVWCSTWVKLCHGRQCFISMELTRLKINSLFVVNIENQAINNQDTDRSGGREVVGGQLKRNPWSNAVTAVVFSSITIQEDTQGQSNCVYLYTYIYPIRRQEWIQICNHVKKTIFLGAWNTVNPRGTYMKSALLGIFKWFPCQNIDVSSYLVGNGLNAHMFQNWYPWRLSKTLV